MVKLTGEMVMKAAQVMHDATEAFEAECVKIGLRKKQLPPELDRALMAMVVAVVTSLHGATDDDKQDDGGFEETPGFGEPPGFGVTVERQSGPPRYTNVAGLVVQETVQRMQQELLTRIRNLKATNKVERGLPNEIAGSDGWQGALDEMEEAVKQIVKAS